MERALRCTLKRATELAFHPRGYQGQCRWLVSMKQNHSQDCPILIAAGEASGDMYAAELAADLRSKTPQASLKFFGCGGMKMREAGVETLVDIHSLAVLGPFEAVSHLAHFFSALRLLTQEAGRRRPSLAILVDFPDFNLRLAKRLKALGIPVIYLISPQVWAWRSDRVHKMKETIERMLVVLPFEKDFYAEMGMEVDYIGHPLVDRVRCTTGKSHFLSAHRLKESLPTVSLLPGSRVKEIKYTLPVLLQTARRLNWERPIQFLAPVSTDSHRTLVEKIKKDQAADLPLTIIEGDTYNAVGHSDIAVVASGTATLEAAILGTPLITVFRISNLTWIVGQYLVNVPFYSLVNLIAGREVIPELFQKDFNVERLYTEMRKYLDDPELMKRVRMNLAMVKQRLGEGGAIHKASEKILPWLRV